MRRRSSCSTAFPNRTAPGARSRRGWQDDFRLIMPDQRGFAGSDRPQDVDDYRDRQAGRRHLRAGRRARPRALRAGRPRLGRSGRLAGGAARRSAARRGWSSSTRRIRSIFQKSLIEDAAQRAASQYITAFRTPGVEKAIEAMGFETFFDKTLRRPCRPGADPGGGEAALSRRMVAARRADRDAQLVPRDASSSCRRPARTRAAPGLGCFAPSRTVAGSDAGRSGG